MAKKFSVVRDSLRNFLAGGEGRGNPEVSECNPTRVLLEEQVLGAHVSMNDSLGVCRGQPPGDTGDNGPNTRPPPEIRAAAWLPLANLCTVT